MSILIVGDSPAQLREVVAALKNLHVKDIVMADGMALVPADTGGKVVTVSAGYVADALNLPDAPSVPPAPRRVPSRQELRHLEQKAKRQARKARR